MAMQAVFYDVVIGYVRKTRIILSIKKIKFGMTVKAFG